MPSSVKMVNKSANGKLHFPEAFEKLKANGLAVVESRALGMRRTGRGECDLGGRQQSS